MKYQRQYCRWSFNALLKEEIDGCNLNESSKSFQIFTDLQAKYRCPEAQFEKWDFQVVTVARQPVKVQNFYATDLVNTKTTIPLNYPLGARNVSSAVSDFSVKSLQ